MMMWNVEDGMLQIEFCFAIRDYKVYARVNDVEPKRDCKQAYQERE
jgi:hypothetical protein